MYTLCVVGSCALSLYLYVQYSLRVSYAHTVLLFICVLLLAIPGRILLRGKVYYINIYMVYRERMYVICYIRVTCVHNIRGLGDCHTYCLEENRVRPLSTEHIRTTNG